MDDTEEMCSNCMEHKSVARMTATTDQGVVIDYADLCALCLKEAASAAGMYVTGWLNDRK